MTNHIYIGTYEGLIPYIILANDPTRRIIKIVPSIGSLFTDYVQYIIQSMKCMSMVRKTINNSYSRFILGSGFVMDIQSTDILVLGVGLTNSMPDIIFVSDKFDMVRPKYKYRSMRRYWKKAMVDNKDNGIRVEKVSQEFINQFIVRFNWQPDSKELSTMIRTCKEEVISTLKSNL